MSAREHQNPKKNQAEVRDEIVISDLLGCLPGNGGCARRRWCKRRDQGMGCADAALAAARSGGGSRWVTVVHGADRSEEHTSELQSHHELVCRRLLEKK